MDRTKHRHDPLATDGPIDTIVRIMPAAAPSPPSSPATAQYDLPVGNLEDFSLSKWTPHYLTTLPSLSSDIRSKIPPQQNFTTFTYDFLQNTFGGMAWSPGLRYINSTTSVPLVENRTYYLLDPEHEPYLPKAPGEHGAKLTAFFNKAPEEVFECDGHAEGTNSYTNVPMFIHVSKGRYAYFGHYSQTRWSDRLDNDTMQARVSQDVKQHVANELAATPREPWVTRELKLHFFPVPKYEGTIPTPKTRDDTTNNTREEEKHNKQVAKDISGYIQELAEWEREASMKTAMIKADFILNALDAVSDSRSNTSATTLTSTRLMQMIHLLFDFGGSTSSALTGSPTFTACLLACRLGTTTRSEAGQLSATLHDALGHDATVLRLRLQVLARLFLLSYCYFLFIHNARLGFRG